MCPAQVFIHVSRCNCKHVTTDTLFSFLLPCKCAVQTCFSCYGLFGSVCLCLHCLLCHFFKQSFYVELCQAAGVLVEGWWSFVSQGLSPFLFCFPLCLVASFLPSLCLNTDCQSNGMHLLFTYPFCLSFSLFLSPFFAGLAPHLFFYGEDF